MTKSLQLAELPLWECPDCQRLEFMHSLAFPVCCDCLNVVMEPLRNPNSIYVFEAIAQHFIRDTGYLRPGKSASPMDYRNCDNEAREAAWNKWNNDSLDLSNRKSARPPPAQIR